MHDWGVAVLFIPLLMPIFVVFGYKCIFINI